MIKEIDNYLNRLFPINRSISGEGQEPLWTFFKKLFPFKKGI